MSSRMYKACSSFQITQCCVFSDIIVPKYCGHTHISYCIVGNFEVMLYADPGDLGPRDLDRNWRTLYVYIHSTYNVHVSVITRLECTMEQKFCTVDSTFVLAAFIPFHSEQTASTEHIKYARGL